MTKLTRQFSTEGAASLRRDLFRLCDELDKALATIDRRLSALESAEAPAVYTPSLCTVSATAVSFSSTESVVSFSSAALIDTDGYHDETGAPTRLTAPADGFYRVEASLAEDTNSVSYSFRLRLDNTTFLGTGGTTGAQNDSGANVWWEGWLDAGQYFELLSDSNVVSPTVELVLFSIKRLDR